MRASQRVPSVHADAPIPPNPTPRLQAAGHKLDAILSYVASTLDAELPAKSHEQQLWPATSGSVRHSSSSVASTGGSSDASSQQPTSTPSDFLSTGCSELGMSHEHQHWMRNQHVSEQQRHFVSASQAHITLPNQFQAHPPRFDAAGNSTSSHPTSPPSPQRLQGRSSSFSRLSLTSRFNALADHGNPEDLSPTSNALHDDEVNRPTSRGSHSASQIPMFQCAERSSNSRTSDSSRKWLGATSVPQPPPAGATSARVARHSSSTSSIPPAHVKASGDHSLRAITLGLGSRGNTLDGHSSSASVASHDSAASHASGRVGRPAVPGQQHEDVDPSFDEGDAHRPVTRTSMSGASCFSGAPRSGAGAGRGPHSRSGVSFSASRREEAVDALLSERELGRSIQVLQHTGRNDPLAVALQRTLARERARRHSGGLPAAGGDGASVAGSLRAELDAASRAQPKVQALQSPSLFEVLDRQGRDSELSPAQHSSPFCAPHSAALALQYSLLTQCATGGGGGTNTTTTAKPAAHSNSYPPVHSPTLVPPAPGSQAKGVAQRPASSTRSSPSHRHSLTPTPAPTPTHPSSADLDYRALQDAIVHGYTTAGPSAATAPGPQTHPHRSGGRRSEDGNNNNSNNNNPRPYTNAFPSILHTATAPASAAEAEESGDGLAPLSLVDQRLSAMRLTLSERKLKPGVGAGASLRAHGSDSGYGSGGRPLSTAALLAHGAADISGGTATGQWAARNASHHSSIMDGERCSSGGHARPSTAAAVARQPTADSTALKVAAADAMSSGASAATRHCVSRASSFTSRGRG
ncbi:MAG: hypothetical protein WDW36_001468 [Sanguina aurantia]